MSYYLPKIKIPKSGHYYVLYCNNQQVVAQFVSQSCWNLTFRIVDDSYIDSVDGEFVRGNYSIKFI